MKNTCANCDHHTLDDQHDDLVTCSYYGRTDGREYKMVWGWCENHSAERKEGL